MPSEPEYHYYCRPAATGPVTPDPAVQFLTANDFLADEPACTRLWDLLVSQFNTRSKFLAIWRCVSFVAVYRNAAGVADGFLLVTAPVNWQIDYVVVHPDARGKGVASKLIKRTIAEASARGTPYVMLTSKASLRGMYEGCGFRVVSE
jgi:ribosomal protein S18 acetylase RimI-like enzyme